MNSALKRSDVERDGYHDEFEALGLGSHRSNEVWLQAGKLKLAAAAAVIEETACSSEW